LVKDTCKVRQGSKPPPRPAVRRIGPGCNPVVDYLEKVGGSATIEEIADALGMRRPRDLVRKKTAHPKSRDGLATRLLNIGVVEVSSRAEVSLTEEWLESLNDERVRAGEVASERIDRIEHKIAQEEYRTRHERGADVAPTDDELAARREQFKEALERKKLADFLNKRVLALDAMQTDHSGAQINLQRLMDGDMQNVGYLVKSVLSWHRVPPQQWEIVAGEWKKPVLSAANLLAREYAHEGVAA